MQLVDRYSSSMASFCILSLLIPASLCQLALASSTYFDASPTHVGIGGRETRHTLRKTQATGGISVGIEREIAAIFRGVAYGTTAALPLMATTSATFTTHAPVPSTESGAFIGQQKRVRINVDLIPDAFASLRTPDSQLQSLRSPEAAYSAQNAIIASSNATHLTEKSDVVNHPSFNPTADLPESLRESHPITLPNVTSPADIQIRVINVSGEQGYAAIKAHIDNAWTLHTYLTGTMFCLVAVACILMLGKINNCSQALPRGHYVSIALLIFVAAFFRAVLFLHDPYGAYGRLPAVLISVLYYTVYPCLNTAFAVHMLLIYGAARVQVFPVRVQSPVVLSVICGSHIGLSTVFNITSVLIQNESLVFAMNVVLQSLSSIWGAVLCLIYIFCYSNIEKSVHRYDSEPNHFSISTNTKKNSFPNGLSHAPLQSSARIFMVCCLLNALLIAFAMLDLFSRKVPQNPTSSESWAWLTQSSLERLIEIMLAFLLLASAWTLTDNNAGENGKNGKILSIFKNFTCATGGAKTIDVYPVATVKRNMLKNGSIINVSPASCMSFTIPGWNTSKLNGDSCGKDGDLNIVSGQLHKLAHANTYGKINTFSAQTMPRNRLPGPECCAAHADQQPAKLPRDFDYYPHLNDTAKYLPKGVNEIIYPNSILNEINGYSLNASAACTQCCNHDGNISCSSRSPIYRYENDYEVASYYSNSNSSTNTNIYAKPCPFYSHYYDSNGVARQIPEQPMSSVLQQQEANLRTGNCSYSEIHADYLTDASFTDIITLSRSQAIPVHAQGAICKPISDTTTNLESSPSFYAAEAIPRSDTTDCRVVPGPTDNLRPNPNSNSLNDIIKYQGNFFGKMVSGGGTNNTGYSPLCLEDATLSSYDIKLKENFKHSNSPKNDDINV